MKASKKDGTRKLDHIPAERALPLHEQLRRMKARQRRLRRRRHALLPCPCGDRFSACKVWHTGSGQAEPQPQHPAGFRVSTLRALFGTPARRRRQQIAALVQS